jgi:hypothetical protein
MVVVINAGLIIAMLRSNPSKQIKILTKAARALRNPWEAQNADYDALRDSVSQLQSKEEEKPANDL